MPKKKNPKRIQISCPTCNLFSSNSPSFSVYFFFLENWAFLFFALMSVIFAICFCNFALLFLILNFYELFYIHVYSSFLCWSFFPIDIPVHYPEVFFVGIFGLLSFFFFFLSSLL